MATIDERVERLERKARLFQISTGGLLLILVVPLLLGATKRIPDVVQARAFEVVDPSGSPVVQLESNENGGRVWVWNKRGRVTVSLSNTEERSGVVRLYAHRGNRGLPYIVLSTDEEGGRIVVDGKDNSRHVIEPSN